MIAFLLGLYLACASDEGDSSIVPKFRIGAGLSANNGPTNSLWADLSAQANIDACFLRYEPSLAISHEDPSNISMASGESEPIPIRYRNAAFLGMEKRLSFTWFGIGLGWFWTQFDTLGSSIEDHQIYEQDSNQVRLRTRNCSVVDGCTEFGWIWKDRIRRSGPLALLEFGFGLRGRVKMGGRVTAEIGSEFRLGTGVVYEFP